MADFSRVEGVLRHARVEPWWGLESFNAELMNLYNRDWILLQRLRWCPMHQLKQQLSQNKGCGSFHGQQQTESGMHCLAAKQQPQVAMMSTKLGQRCYILWDAPTSDGGWDIKNKLLHSHQKMGSQNEKPQDYWPQNASGRCGGNH